jgi:hypothetical protein
MKTIKIAEFRKDADELEFWIPSDYTCKMISHLRGYDVIVQIRISPMEDNKIFRDQDAFFLTPAGGNERRTKIKQSINGFCEKHGLTSPKWPGNFGV